MGATTALTAIGWIIAGILVGLLGVYMHVLFVVFGLTALLIIIMFIFTRTKHA